MKKGFLPFTLAIIGIIFTITTVIFITLPLLLLKYHLAINLKREYDYNNAQLALLSLISSKHESSSMYRIISERNQSLDEDTKKKIGNSIELLIQKECFRLVTDKATIIQKPDCFASRNVGEIYIFRPYDKGLVEKLILVYE